MVFIRNLFPVCVIEFRVDNVNALIGQEMGGLAIEKKGRNIASIYIRYIMIKPNRVLLSKLAFFPLGKKLFFIDKFIVERRFVTLRDIQWL